MVVLRVTGVLNLLCFMLSAIEFRSRERSLSALLTYTTLLMEKGQKKGHGLLSCIFFPIHAYVHMHMLPTCA